MKSRLYTVVVLIMLCWSCGKAQREPTRTSQLEDYKEVIRFVNKGDTLEGELLVPILAMIDKKKVPVVVFVHGSGRATRQDYWSISDRLNSEGYATFRYDKRGVGRSGGTF